MNNEQKMTAEDVLYKYFNGYDRLSDQTNCNVLAAMEEYAAQFAASTPISKALTGSRTA